MSTVYMDYQATTPLDPLVLEKMMPYFTEKFGNPHSRTHSFGWEAEEAVEHARQQVAALINADSSEVIFTSGATESNNLALKGCAKFHQASNKKHIITLQTEHKCVLDACRNLGEEGVEVTYLGVKSDGMIDLQQLAAAMREDTLMVSIMAVNNEIGVIQPLAQIGQLCRERGVIFHTDAAQAFGKIPLDVKAMKIDLLSISGHKIYGPKGIGALYVGKKPRIRLRALISGGGQERGMRSGTLPTPLVVGLGEAARLAGERMEVDHRHVSKLSARLIAYLQSIPHVYINGSSADRYPGCINASFACIEGESMIGALKGVAVSSGSACTSSSLEPSYVLKALGIDEDLSHTSIRFGVGRFSTEADIDLLIEKLNFAVKKLRDMSPLWEMLEQGIDLKSIHWVH